MTMTGFAVEPKYVTGLGELMTYCGDAAGLFSGHLRDRAAEEPGDGFLGKFNKTLNPLCHVGEWNTGMAARLGQACGGELVKAADFYVRENDGTAATLDSIYPAAVSTKVDGGGFPGGPPQSFTEGPDPKADPKNPQRQYSGPPVDLSGQEGEYLDGWPVGLEKVVDDINGKVSVAQQARDLITKVCGKDIFGILITYLTGDWQDVMRRGMVFEDTGFAFKLIKERVDRGRYLVQDNWDGNAAASAENWLAGYSRSCEEHATFMAKVGDHVRKYANACYHAFSQVNIFLDTLLDLLADLLLKGGATAVGGVISVLRGDNLLKTIASIILQVTRIGTILDMLWVVFHGIVGAIQAIAAERGIGETMWPATPYDHPAVR